jgi:AcrR family transcriptional regulator
MSSQRAPLKPIGSVPAGRRHVTPRQADTVHKLCVAAMDEIRAEGYDALTVRNVARRAGVAPATAYTYFASKDHLVTEIFWQQLLALPRPNRADGRPPTARLTSMITDLGEMLASEPELAAACTPAMLANDPDVHRLRDRIGDELYTRLSDALGEDRTSPTVDALGLALSGALMHAGMGVFAFDELADRVVAVAALLQSP